MNFERLSHNHVETHCCASHVSASIETHSRASLLILALLPLTLNAYNLRQLSSKEGLSNSAILSICQDSERFVWFGSVDGLNVYNGVDVNIFKPNAETPASLSGNLIEEVSEGEDGVLWINTNHGLNRYDKLTKEIACFEQFEGKYHLAKTAGNQIFVIRENGLVDWYDSRNKKFISLPYPETVVKSDVQRIFIDSGNVLWIISNNGTVGNASISTGGNAPVIKPLNDFEHSAAVRYMFMENDRIYFIDANDNLFEMDAVARRKSFVINLKKEVAGRGIVSSIIKDDDDYLVAFKTNGLLRLRNTPERETKYVSEEVSVFCGVFCLFKDEKQDIIWIGTDGQGVYMYTRDLFSLRSATFGQLPFPIRKPVRAIFLDKKRNLWIGTKDDGVALVKDYAAGDDVGAKEISHITSSNSALTNNSIYAFGESSRNILWIGGDGPGLNYYSYRDRTVKKLAHRDFDPLVYVHAIHEVGDTALWLASVGAGVFKVVIDGTADEPTIRSVRRFTFTNDEMAYNYFFTACRENDSILWFGNRGYGLQRLNLTTETFSEVRFHQKNIRTINDILSMYRDEAGNVWVGTSFGVLKLLDYDPATHKVSYESYNEIEGLPNNTIHGILEDGAGYLWLSTNGGVVRFDAKKKNFQLYNHKNGLDVFEFSDGAYFKDDKTGDLFFGGTNGFVTVEPDVYKQETYVPKLFFTGLSVYENERNLNDRIRQSADGDYLELRHDENFFSISFIAIDYINGQNCKYDYNLENFHQNRIDNGRSNVVHFTNIPPGEYTLHVRCNNGLVTTEAASLRIVVLPPWYAGGVAFFFYILLAALTVFVSIQAVRKRYRRKREHIIERMNQQQKEELYESKLRFFTNITHEFSTPLTLIYGPCNRIIAYEKADGYVKKYAGMIMKNTTRLNALIQELIEFRRIETGNRACVVERLNVTELATGVVDSFAELAEEKLIDYRADVRADLFWNSDAGFLTTILTNLLSNAFKYTPDGGRIVFSVGSDGDLLEIGVTNTGKGIKEKDISYVFDRYRVLENLEKETQTGIFSRNGLGLAICHNMVKLLDGTITVSSVIDEFTKFRVALPAKETTTSRSSGSRIALAQSGKIDLPHESPSPRVATDGGDRLKPTIIVVDDDHEMCRFIAEVLSARYHVIPVENPAAVPEIVKLVQPAAIISDIMMPGVDGVALMKQIKSDRRTAHIPFILLSAKNTPEDQTEGVAAGAEAYIVKPFHVEYLQTVIERLLCRQNDMKTYFRSAISAYEFEGGQFIHGESRAFFDKMILAIDKNLTDADFSPEQLAKEMGVSARHLYRRLKEITDRTPAELIKDYRLATAEKLLVTSRDSVDEVMYKVGFNSRGSFFRLFARKYGATPKQYRQEHGEASEFNARTFLS